MIDYDQELRRAERYSDLSRSAFTVGVAALATIAVLTIVLFGPWYG